MIPVPVALHRLDFLALNGGPVDMVSWTIGIEYVNFYCIHSIIEKLIVQYCSNRQLRATLSIEIRKFE
jgi:hypothetical protein